MEMDLIFIQFFQFQILIGVKMSLLLKLISSSALRSSVHIDNKNKDILILRKGSTQELDNTTLTAET